MRSNPNPILLLFCCFFGCGANEQQIVKEFRNLQIEVIANYKNNKARFGEIESCLAFKYIKRIEFKQDERVSLQYKMAEDAKLVKIEGPISAQTIQAVLRKEGLTVDSLLSIKKRLNSLKISQIRIIDDYDGTHGFPFKKMEMKYDKEVNELYFFYRVFEKPLDSIESGHYDLNSQKGYSGILDKDIIYYYR